MTAAAIGTPRNAEADRWTALGRTTTLIMPDGRFLLPLPNDQGRRSIRKLTHGPNKRELSTTTIAQRARKGRDQMSTLEPMADRDPRNDPEPTTTTPDGKSTLAPQAGKAREPTTTSLKKIKHGDPKVRNSRLPIPLLKRIPGGVGARNGRERTIMLPARGVPRGEAWNDREPMDTHRGMRANAVVL